MKIIKNMVFLFKKAWKTSRSLIVIVGVVNILLAVKPLVNIMGFGLVIHALATNQSLDTILLMITGYLLLVFLIDVLSEWIRLKENMLLRKVSNTMQFDYMEDSLTIDYHYVRDGTVLDMKKKSMGAHPALFFADFGAFIKYFVQLSGIATIFFLFNPWFILVLIITLSISSVLTFRKRNLEFIFNNEKVKEERKLEYLSNTMSSYFYAKEIRINKAADFLMDRYEKTFSNQIECYNNFYKRLNYIGLFSLLITILQTLSMYGFFSYLVFQEQIDIATYTVLISSTTLLTSIIISFLDQLAKSAQTSKYVDMYKDYQKLLDSKSTISKSNQLRTTPINLNNFIIKFENVSFKYPDTNHYVLKDIKFEVKNSERVGIVGLNGSGKTTLINLLTRVYDPTDGKITLNGVDIKEIPYAFYSRHFGIVLQDFFLFAYSVKENIVFHQQMDDVRLRESIEQSGLTEKISRIKKGLDTSVYKELDDDGIEFSGGEGQKVAMARALYKDAKLLILDEPTSALDPIEEIKFFNRLNNRKDSTKLFISHRLSSTKFCDVILVLEEGKIVEKGNHESLMRHAGLYHDLFQAQAEFFKKKWGDV